eukprot:5454753-Pyramimonas_sp.AAC.1
MSGMGFERKVVGGAEKVTSMSTRQVLAYWRVAPCRVEVHVRRPGMCQGWSRDAEKSAQMLRSLFGDIHAGAGRPQLVDGKPCELSS